MKMENFGKNEQLSSEIPLKNVKMTNCSCMNLYLYAFLGTIKKF